MLSALILFTTSAMDDEYANPPYGYNNGLWQMHYDWEDFWGDVLSEGQVDALNWGGKKFGYENFAITGSFCPNRTGKYTLRVRGSAFSQLGECAKTRDGHKVSLDAIAYMCYKVEINLNTVDTCTLTLLKEEELITDALLWPKMLKLMQNRLQWQ